MAKCDRISIADLVRGWLDAIEVESLNTLAESRAFVRVQESPYTINQSKYAEWQLATIRKLKHRIPGAWKKATVTESDP